MRYRIRFVVIFILIFTWIQCNKSQKSDSLPFIATSIFPIYDLVSQVAGNTSDTWYFVPAEANPHTYELMPSQATRLRKATCYIGVQREFDGWVERFLSPGTPVYYLSDAFHPQEGNNAKEDHHNPHIWLSIRSAKTLIDYIQEILSGIYPESERLFQQNAKRYESRLDSVDAVLTNQFMPLKDKKFIQWHPAWDQFARDYHLKIIGTVENGHGHELSVKEFHALISKAQKEDVHVVVIGLNTNSSTTSALVHEIHGQKVYLDTIGDVKNPGKNTYIKLMLSNAEQLVKALEAS